MPRHTRACSTSLTAHLHSSKLTLCHRGCSVSRVRFSPMLACNSFPTDPATDSLTPRASVGFLRFPAFSLGRVGNRGRGCRSPKPEAPVFPRLWDFSLFRPFLWDVWENRGDGGNQLATFHLQFASVFPRVTRVTRAYFVDSIHHVEKLHRISDCDINHYVISRLRLRTTISRWQPH